MPAINDTEKERDHGSEDESVDLWRLKSKQDEPLHVTNRIHSHLSKSPSPSGITMQIPPQHRRWVSASKSPSPLPRISPSLPPVSNSSQHQTSSNRNSRPTSPLSAGTAHDSLRNHVPQGRKTFTSHSLSPIPQTKVSPPEIGVFGSHLTSQVDKGVERTLLIPNDAKTKIYSLNTLIGDHELKTPSPTHQLSKGVNDSIQASLEMQLAKKPSKPLQSKVTTLNISPHAQDEISPFIPKPKKTLSPSIFQLNDKIFDQPKPPPVSNPSTLTNKLIRKQQQNEKKKKKTLVAKAVSDNETKHEYSQIISNVIGRSYLTDEELGTTNIFKILSLAGKDEEDLFQSIEANKYFSGLELQDILHTIKLEAPKEFTLWDLQRKRRLEKQKEAQMLEEKKRLEEEKRQKQLMEEYMEEEALENDGPKLDTDLDINVVSLLTSNPIPRNAILKTFEGVERKKQFVQRMEEFHSHSSKNYEKTKRNENGVFFDYGKERLLFSIIDSEMKLKRSKSDSNLLSTRNTELNLYHHTKRENTTQDDSVVKESISKLKSSKHKEILLKSFQQLLTLKKPRLKRNKSDSDLINLFCEEIIDEPNQQLFHSERPQDAETSDAELVSLTNTSLLTIQDAAYSFSSRLNSFSNHNQTTITSVLFPHLSKEDQHDLTEQQVKKALESFYESLKKKASELTTQTALEDQTKENTQRYSNHLNVQSHGLAACFDDDPLKKLILQRKKESGVKMKVTRFLESDHVVEREEIDFIQENIRQLRLKAQQMKQKKKYIDRQPIFENTETDTSHTAVAQIKILDFNPETPSTAACKPSPRTNLLSSHSARKQLLSNVQPLGLVGIPSRSAIIQRQGSQPSFSMSITSISTPRLSEKHQNSKKPFTAPNIKRKTFGF
ncbi:hypothetical protein C9374_005449 [Naegleria lovaniensis]|uniref:Uncharacterized protein n=1 Tax=Naegleria lovaniensis TaxID=51637 RepID=A0AA88KII5_NAELO|nr:uncharacterized protein C9374_005449 [Naegleria lovaniensis]KAG2382247.1 hypothetical protein C9374_005449 [Naegleria lovaniensis]